MSIIDTLTELTHKSLVNYWKLLGVDVFETDLMLLASTKIPFSFMNVLLHTSKQITPSDLPDMFMQANQYFRSHNVPWTWWLEPYITPPDLEKFLHSRSFALTYSCPTMALDLSDEVNPAPLEGFNIKEVMTMNDFNEWVKPIRRSFNCPQHVFDLFSARLNQVEHGPDAAFRHFIIQEGTQTVASSTIHLDDDSATIYNIATLPEHRRKGLGMAVTLQCVLAAKERNLRYCFLDSSKVGYNIYHRIGFRQFTECKIFGTDK